MRVAERSAELERLYSEVARANTAKSEFLANISHELRTPLNAIVGFVELLKDSVYGDLSPRQVPPVDRIAASATHLRHLVDQVLDIAKIAAGRLEVHPETIVLRPFVLNVASELESLVNERGLSLSIAVGAIASACANRSDAPAADSRQPHRQRGEVHAVRRHLGSRAARRRHASADARSRRHTPGGPAVRHAHAGCAPHMDRAAGDVDTGVGIAPGDQARIFEEFEQVNAGPRGESMQRGTGSASRSRGGSRNSSAATSALRASSEKARRSRCGCRSIRRIWSRRPRTRSAPRNGAVVAESARRQVFFAEHRRELGAEARSSLRSAGAATRRRNLRANAMTSA